MIQKIFLASPRGYCAGVERAITLVEKTLDKFPHPIYVRHQIVHNNHVIENLESKGTKFVESLNEIPKDSIVIFSAHGVPPNTRAKAKELSLKAIDATCPLVAKVHNKAKLLHNQGYEIILIGKKGHQEVIGTMAEAPMHLIENLEQVDQLIMTNPKVAYLTQTTLSVDDTKEIIDKLKQKFPNIESPGSDICYATQNRQDAVKQLAKNTQLILVVGSDTSSNSRRLAETAKNNNATSYLISDKSKIKPEWFDNQTSVGITSGASVPEYLVKDVIAYIKDLFPHAETQDIISAKESITFPAELEFI